jgi:predicted amidohydrolase YtcJ
VLEGFEMAGITPKDRAILTHCQILGEDLLQKMQNMGVIANIQYGLTQRNSNHVLTTLFQTAIRHHRQRVGRKASGARVIAVLLLVEDYHGKRHRGCGR